MAVNETTRPSDPHDVYAPPSATIATEPRIASPRARFWFACFASFFAAPLILFVPVDSWIQYAATVLGWMLATAWVLIGDAKRFPGGGIGRWLFLATGLGIGMIVFAAAGSVVGFVVAMGLATH